MGGKGEPNIKKRRQIKSVKQDNYSRNDMGRLADDRDAGGGSAATGGGGGRCVAWVCVCISVERRGIC